MPKLKNQKCDIFESFSNNVDNPKLRYQQLLSEASFHLLALKLLEYLSRLPKCFSLIGKKRKTWQSTVHYKTILIIELHFLVYSKLNFLENNFVEKKVS